MTAQRDFLSDTVDDRPGQGETAGHEEAGLRPLNGVITRWLRRWLLRWRSILLVLLVTGAAALAACVFFLQYRPNQQTNDTAGRDAIEAASSGTVALLSYSPDTLDRDFATAKAHLTGDFLAYYDKFTHQIVTPAAREAHVRTTVAVIRTAVAELHPRSAVVLAFVNQSTTSKNKPEPVVAASAVRIGLTKVNGAWLISSFNPV